MAALVAVFVFLVCFLAAVLTYKVAFPSRAEKHLSKIPGPKRYPIIGNAHNLPRDPFEFYRYIVEMSIKHDQLFLISQGIQNIVVVARAEDTEALLKTTKHNEKAFQYNVFNRWLKKGLLTSQGSKWHQRRKLLTPAFHFDILEQTVGVMLKQTRLLLSLLDQYAAQGKEVDAWEMLSLLALDIISESAMGVSIEAQGRSDDAMAYVTAREQVTAILQERVKYPWLWNDLTYYHLTSMGRKEAHYTDVMHKFTNKVIKARYQELCANPDLVSGSKKKSFLDVLLLAQKEHNFTFSDIHEEVETFMFEGHDTTSAAMSFVLIELAFNPEVQRKLQEEVDQKLDALYNGDDFDWKGLSELKYLDAVVREGLRLYPSVPGYGRVASEDFNIREYTIPKGTSVWLFPYYIHRDPAIYHRPEEFVPERWVEKRVPVDKIPFCYIPFSAGPRNCIGQKMASLEERIVIANIVKRFNITTNQKREDMKICGEIIIRSKSGVRLFFQPR